MKQSRLFSAALVSFIAIVLISVSHLSAAVTFWDDFDSPGSGHYDSVHHWGDNPIDPTLDLDEFNTFKILWTTDSVQLYWNPDEIHGQELFPDIPIYETFYAIPDKFLTPGINSRTSIPGWPSEWDSDMQPASEPADYIVCNNDADYIKSMRIPAPASLVLVALGLLSLRFTRRLRY